MTRVLVVAAHPDDESVGCGGTLLLHRLRGDEVRVVFLTSGEAGGHGAPPEEVGPLREAEARAAAAVLDVGDLEFWHLPDGRLRATASAIERLRALLSSYRPDVVYVTSIHESHPDHRAAARIVAAARDEAAVPEVLMTEVWTPLQRLDQIIDVTSVIDRKIAAIQAHASQCAVVDFADAFHGLARYRGAMHCWPEGDYAEVFEAL